MPGKLGHNHREGQWQEYNPCHDGNWCHTETHPTSWHNVPIPYTGNSDHSPPHWCGNGAKSGSPAIQALHIVDHTGEDESYYEEQPAQYSQFPGRFEEEMKDGGETVGVPDDPEYPSYPQHPTKS